MKLKSIENIFYVQMIIYVFNVFEAEIQVLGLKEKQIIDDCFICHFHFHSFIEECSIDIKWEIDRKIKTEKKTNLLEVK